MNDDWRIAIGSTRGRMDEDSQIIVHRFPNGIRSSFIRRKSPSNREAKMVSAFLLQPDVARVVVGKLHDEHPFVFRQRGGDLLDQLLLPLNVHRGQTVRPRGSPEAALRIRPRTHLPRRKTTAGGGVCHRVPAWRRSGRQARAALLR